MRALESFWDLSFEVFVSFLGVVFVSGCCVTMFRFLFEKATQLLAQSKHGSSLAMFISTFKMYETTGICTLSRLTIVMDRRLDDPVMAVSMAVSTAVATGEKAIAIRIRGQFPIESYVWKMEIHITKGG